jgi:hypothetical protein
MSATALTHACHDGSPSAGLAWAADATRPVDERAEKSRDRTVGLVRCLVLDAIGTHGSETAEQQESMS